MFYEIKLNFIWRREILLDMTTGGWTKKVELLLQNWSRQISINEAEYRRGGVKKRRLYRGLAVFLIISQTGALTTLVNTIMSIMTGQSTKDCIGNISTTIAGALIFIAIMGTITLIVQGVDKFYNFGAVSEQYFQAAKNLKALSRLVDSMLSLKRADRDPAREALLAIRQQFDQILNSSPDLPNNDIIHRLDLVIYENPAVAKGMTRTSLETDAKPVKLPQSPPDDRELEPDEEHVSIGQLCRMGVQMQNELAGAENDAVRKNFLNSFDYQWNRLNLDREEEEDSEKLSQRHKTDRARKRISAAKKTRRRSHVEE